MVSIIMGLKGSGKTKKLVELVRAAVNEETGDVVCIEKERKLTYDICGIHAGNYDITHFFIDNFYKLVNDKSPEALETFLTWLEKFSDQEKISFVISISADPATVSESVKKYLI